MFDLFPFSLSVCLFFDYGYKDTAAFSYFQIFLDFFLYFFHCLKIIHIYSGFPRCLCSSLFRLSCVPVVVCSGRVPVVCPVFLNHTRAYIRTRTAIFRR